MNLGDDLQAAAGGGGNEARGHLEVPKCPASAPSPPKRTLQGSSMAEEGTLGTGGCLGCPRRHHFRWDFIRELTFLQFQNHVASLRLVNLAYVPLDRPNE